MNHIPSPLAAGVPPEGFQDIHEVRILLCCILNAVPEPMSKNDLARLFQENHLVNYFTLSAALSELLSEKQATLIDRDGEACYQLDDFGIEAAKALEHTIPLSVREHVSNAAQQLMHRKKNERENEILIEPHHNGYSVQIIMHDTDIDLLNLKLFVPDQTRAERVQEKMLQNPAAFYAQIIDFLTK